MTLNSIFAGAIGIGIVGAVGYGIYKGLKGDKPSKARLAMRARTSAPTSVAKTTVPTPVPVAKATVPAPAPVVETSAPTPNEFVSVKVKEAVSNCKKRVSIKDLRAEAREDLFEKYDGEIYEEDLQWFNAAVEEKVQEYAKEAEDAGLRVLR